MDENGVWNSSVIIYVSQDLMDNYLPRDYVSPTFISCFVTDSPEMISEYIDKMDLVNHTVRDAQNEAIKEMKMQTKTKYVIAIMLLVILGINMFGSLSNILGERKFEIGIKRAIGAPCHKIVLQFFFESLIIMVLNMVLSVICVSQIALVMKVIIKVFGDEQWIFYLSPYSILTYLISCLSVTVLFSSFLAYKATRVEVVSQLKLE